MSAYGDGRDLEEAVESVITSYEPHVPQSAKLLEVIRGYLHESLDESYSVVHTEVEMRKACETQLSGLSSRVDELKSEYSNALKLREDEISQYQKEVEKLFESNKRKVDSLNRAQTDWVKLQNAPELLHKRKDELIQLERNCLTKHVTKIYSSEQEWNSAAKSDHIKTMSIDKLRSEVKRTWNLINQQQKLLERLLDQLYFNLQQADQSFVHDCNGNIIAMPPSALLQNDVLFKLQNPSNLTNQKDPERSSALTQREQQFNSTHCLLDALISIGSLCKTAPLQSNIQQVTTNKDSAVASKQTEVMELLESRLNKFEKLVRNFDDEKIEQLKDSLSEKISALEMKTNLKHPIRRDGT